ncbi:MAG: hypothetical protein QM817_00315 [Archangium sp.]
MPAPTTMPSADAGAPNIVVADAGVVDASVDAGIDAGVVTPHVNEAEKVWRAQNDVWLTGSTLRRGDCHAALSWLIAVKRGTGSVQNGIYTELSANNASFTPGGNTLKVRNQTGFSGELRIDSVVGDVSIAGFPHGTDFVDVSWLWSDGTSARCQLREKSDHIFGRFFVDGTRCDVDFTSTTESEVSSGYDPQTYTSNVLILGHGVVSGTLSTLNRDRVVTVNTESDWSSCSGSPCYTSSLWYEHHHLVTVRFTNETWSLDYKTGFEKQTTASVEKKLWRGSITGPSAGVLIATPVASVFSLDVVIGADRYSTGSAIQVQ